MYGFYDVIIANDPTLELHSFIGVWRLIKEHAKQDVAFVGGCKLLLVILRQLSHCQLTILKYCVDIYIISVSVILTVRFRQIAERIDVLIQKKVENTV